MTSRWTLSAVVFGLLIQPACLSIERADYHERKVDAGRLRDGSADGASAASECRACLSGDGGLCTPEFMACSADPACGQAIQCALAHGCLNIADLAARIGCATPCLQQANIVAGTPALDLALSLNACASSKCAGTCATLGP
ncbi:MAG TPA: hypothetical protein VHE30_29105 [Polyangiaceae bacterium]|nr:hypothetical protein [Polyangiaceae bacterium]